MAVWPPQTHQDVTDAIQDLMDRPPPVTTIPNFTRRYVNGAWQVRGTSDVDQVRWWIKTDASFPDPPEGGSHFRVGVDILLKAT